MAVKPVSSAELISDGVRPELLVFLALRRAARGGLTQFGGHYFARGYRTPSWLAGTFQQLLATGLLALAVQDPVGLQRVSLTPAGQHRYQQLAGTLRPSPDPAPAGQRAGLPGHGIGTSEAGRLAAAQSVLRGVIALAEQAPGISDEQLRSRLLTLAQRAGTVDGSR